MRYEVHENELTDNQREMRYEKRRTRKNDLFFFFFFSCFSAFYLCNTSLLWLVAKGCNESYLLQLTEVSDYG